jgi:hypothetical protein
MVMWKLKDGQDKAAVGRELKRRLESLPALIPEIKAFQVGLNVLVSDTSRDVVLESSFEDLAALDRYVKHPAHQEVAAYIKQAVDERRAVDYEAAG